MKGSTSQPSSVRLSEEKMPQRKRLSMEKKAFFSLVFLFGCKKFITEKVLRVERRTANNP